MEALTAAAVAALTVYDMTKALDKGIVIRNIQLEANGRQERGVFENGRPRVIRLAGGTVSGGPRFAGTRLERSSSLADRFLSITSSQSIYIYRYE